MGLDLKMVYGDYSHRTSIQDSASDPATSTTVGEQDAAVALLLFLSGCMQRLIRFKSAVLIACIAMASVITPIDADAGIGDFFHDLFHRKQPSQTQKQSPHQTPQKSHKKQPAKPKKHKFQEHEGR